MYSLGSKPSGCARFKLCGGEMRGTLSAPHNFLGEGPEMRDAISVRIRCRCIVEHARAPIVVAYKGITGAPRYQNSRRDYHKFSALLKKCISYLLQLYYSTYYCCCAVRTASLKGNDATGSLQTSASKAWPA